MFFNHFLQIKLLEDYQSLSGLIASFLKDMVQKAYQKLKSDTRRRPFIVYLQMIWPQNARNGNVLVFPKELGNGLSGKSIQFIQINDPNITAYTNHQNGEFSGMTFNARLIDNARDPQNAIEKILSVIDHEVEHIFYPGKSNQDPVEYMTDIGEMRAHAREIAEGYKKRFPNMVFSPRLAERMVKDEPFNQTHRNYLIGMKGSKTYEQMLNLIASHF